MAYSPDEIRELLPLLTPAERAEVARLLRQLDRPWFPLPGPQTLAYESRADIIGYGGAAGGGKTDLACGKTITRHQRVMILRRVGTELTAIIDRFTELLGNKDGYNGQDKIWRTRRFDARNLQIEFGAVPNLGDEKKYQGRPHDLLVFDEAANFLELQVRFLLGWLRSVDHSQVCQALLCFNPPTSAEGRWIIDFFAPWLDRKYPNPALPGELRWAAMVPGENGVSRDVWVDGPEPFVLADGLPCYDFDPDDFAPTEIISPRSRTFIPSRVTDNPHLYGTGYMSQLQALPEPLRSQMLNGDFHAGMEDDPWQVIPTAWVEAAQARWVKLCPLPVMDSMGVDVARGGRDNTILARRHGMWFDEPLVYPGASTPDGPKVAGLVIAALRDLAPIHVDVIGVGSSPYDFLMQARQQAIGVNVAEGSTAFDKSGRLGFTNLRSELWWKMREALDPTNNTGIALPPSTQLLTELCAPTWKLQGPLIRVESREEIIARIGKSPDFASAYILALMDTPRMAALDGRTLGKPKRDYDPYA